MIKVFQIGFNKCGTTSLYNYFISNGIKSVHWYVNKRLTIAQLMYTNFIQNKKILKTIENRYQFFSDMEAVIIDENNQEKIFYGYTLFKLLDKQYPNSKFIFNTRNIDDWIASRIKHNHLNYNYLERRCKIYNKTKEEVLDMWRRHYYEHTQNVKDYFKDTPHKILYFDLDINNHNDIYDFLHNDVILNKNLRLTHKNKTLN